MKKRQVEWASRLILGLLFCGVGSSALCEPPFDYLPDPSNTPAPQAELPGIQTFYGAEQQVGNGTARSFITAVGTVPLSVGWELTSAALTGLPDVPPDEETPVYAAPLPPEAASLGLPFKFMIIIYSSGHRAPNTATDEPIHFHAALLVNPPQTAAPPFAQELTPVAPAELPPGIGPVMLASGEPVLVPGIGVNYDDPTQPAGFPPLTTLGQNWFYFGGHMNAIVLGPTIEFLQSKESFAQAIKQPQVYPAAGVYPHIWITRFDPEKNVHVIGVTDFQAARQSVRQ